MVSTSFGNYVTCQRIWSKSRALVNRWAGLEATNQPLNDGNIEQEVKGM